MREDTEERLQKVIAHSGITSRRKAEQYILDGRVKVNHEIITTLGTKVGMKDEVTVDNIPIERERPVYYMLYKPRGVISAVADDKGRKTVVDLLEEVPERIFPIGRLDYNSSGIILLTNDGNFANKLMHPRYGIKKDYIAKVKGIPSKKELDQLKKGFRDKQDVLKIMHYDIKTVDKRKQTAIIELTLREGRNRHIRRMMEGIGYPVTKLSREKYGFLTLKGLKPGDYRKLSNSEIHQFKQLVETRA